MDPDPMGVEAEPVRVGVIGLGNMGRHHVRVLAELPGVELVALADPSEAARAEAMRGRAVRGYADYRELLDREDLEAVTIAVPTSRHEEAALAAVGAGLPFLVEKPLADTVEAARRIVQAAEEAGVPGTVGHIERYNPAVTALRRGLEAEELGRLFQVRITRTGPLPDRIRDVGVVVDLATHDLDMIRYLVAEPIELVFAQSARRIHSAHEDLCNALVRFAGGTIALLDVSWLTPIKVRELVAVGDGGMYRLDYLDQDLSFYENSHVGFWSDSTGRQGVSEGNMVRYALERAEPLKVEMASFAAAVRGEDALRVSLADGTAAVALAEAVKRSAAEHRPVVPGELFPEVFAPDGLVERA